MQTTLRIDDQLYREAKAEAAREGVTLTRFLEEGIRLRLARRLSPAAASRAFRTWSAGAPDVLSAEEIQRIANGEQEKHDTAKLGLSTPAS